MTGEVTKERPIIFSGESIKAILEGRKAQSRLAVSASNSTVLGHPGKSMWSHLHFDYEKGDVQVRADGPADTPFGCGPGVQYLHVPAWHPEEPEEVVLYRVRPIWETGDTLWVRETWSPDHAAFYPNFPIVFRADYRPGTEPDGNSPESGEKHPFRWRSPIHMPRWASRLTLEITGVKVERLQRISEADAQAEGVEQAEGLIDMTYRMGFKNAWNKLNGNKSPWASNPWIFAISFKVVA